MDIHHRVADILEKYYDIKAVRIEQTPGGWSALAYLVEGSGAKYFLKVFDKERPSAVQWINAIDRYIPLVKWLCGHTILKRNLVNPICTVTDKNKCEDERFVYMLSEYAEGKTVGEDSLGNIQVDELAKILGVLHGSTTVIPNELIELQAIEDFETSYCDNLSYFILNDLHTKQDAVLRIASPCAGCLLDLIDRMRLLSDSLKRNPKQFVMCHADAHNWNLLQGQSLMLIDWECVKLAPQEQDLILIVTEPYAARFLGQYRKYMIYVEPDMDAFEFYFLKRKLEDIWEWIKDLRFQGLMKSEEHTLQLLQSTLDECTRIDSFRQDLKGLFAKT